MGRKFLYKNKSRKGLSTIVITLILIALSMASVVIVWAFVSNLIKKQTASSEACFGNSDKVTINGRYTCYEKISDNNYKLRFSLSIGDVSADKVIVSVSSGGSTNSYQITNIAQSISNLKMYSGANPYDVILPGKNSGLTYNASSFTSKIDSIRIAPVIGENVCEVSDSVSEIENCEFLS